MKIKIAGGNGCQKLEAKKEKRIDAEAVYKVGIFAAQHIKMIWLIL